MSIPAPLTHINLIHLGTVKTDPSDAKLENVTIGNEKTEYAVGSRIMIDTDLRCYFNIPDVYDVTSILYLIRPTVDMIEFVNLPLPEGWWRSVVELMEPTDYVSDLIMAHDEIVLVDGKPVKKEGSIRRYEMQVAQRGNCTSSVRVNRLYAS